MSTKLAWELNVGVSRQTDHLTGTSAHAPQGPRSRLPTIRKEKLSVYTFGNKTPIEKDYDVVKLTFKNKDSPNLKIDIEALVIDQISVTNIPAAELDNIPQAVQLENFVLAESPDCQEPITILIGADYYYDVVTGKIKHLSKKLVVVETIFGWGLQGRNSENQSSLALSVIVEENLISDQLKKFWDLEVSGLIDSKNESVVSENQLMKNFESNIKYDEKAKRYKVGLPWKLEARELKDNREIAEKRFTRLRKRFQKNPHLFLEYREILQNYLKQGIIELVPDSDSDSNNVTFYLPHRNDIIGSQPFVNQALTITLEATKIFKDASISLHKWQTNSKSLHKAWQNKGVISDENPHFETFEKDNLPYKVLGIQNTADIVSRGVKISRLLNDTSWLQGPEWLRLPPEFWPESKNENSPDSPDLEYRKI
ncbi:integrase catalytic domain-containing protein [Trichonephila clavipes]|nr:integrase catalytic domain-containing protein [Trichonephila clavipes]